MGNNEEVLLEFFAAAKKSDSGMSKHLSEEHYKAIEIENISVSEYSEGIVIDEEVVARKIYSPIHIDENGKLKTAAFQDASDKGLSVDRMSLSTTETLQEQGKEKAEADNKRKGENDREFVGLYTTQAIEIRKLSTLDIIRNPDGNGLSCITDNGRENQHLYAIYDTAMEENKAHADVCLVSEINSKQNIPKKKLAKKIAIKILTDTFSLHET